MHIICISIDFKFCGESVNEVKKGHSRSKIGQNGQLEVKSYSVVRIKQSTYHFYPN